MADEGSDSGANLGDQGNQGDQGNAGEQGGDQQAKPLTINADMLGEYKDDPVFKPFHDKPVSEVLKSFKNAQSLVGGEKLVIPSGKLDTPENWAYVFDKLGRPKDIEGYQVDTSIYPESIKIDEDRTKAFKEMAHSIGLLPKQAAALYEWNAKLEVATINAMNEAENTRADETADQLKRELGTKEKYEEYVAGAQAALKRYGGAPDEVAAFIDKFGNDPLVIRTFGNVARNMMEDAALRGDKSFNLMGEDAPAQVRDIMTNKDNKLYAAYWEENHPLHTSAVSEVTRLNELIHGHVPIKMEG
jgi:DNA-binding ferritin-like protein (Dps family)